MEESDQTVEEPLSSSTNLLDLPEEILEYILVRLSPYRDLHAARRVCKLWYKIVQGKHISDNSLYSPFVQFRFKSN